MHTAQQAGTVDSGDEDRLAGISWQEFLASGPMSEGPVEGQAFGDIKGFTAAYVGFLTGGKEPDPARFGVSAELAEVVTNATTLGVGAGEWLSHRR
jgi:hypothetical protein